MNLRRAALVAAGVLALGSIGDVFVVALLLAVGAGDVAASITAGVVAVVAVIRIGSSSLSALAGAQAVLGPAGWIGPPIRAAGVWASAAGLMVSAPAGWAALPFGAFAALVVAGPTPRTGYDVALRAAAMIAAMAVAATAGRWRPRRVVWVGVAAAGIGLALSVLG